MEAITAQRSLLLSDEEALHGQTIISLEGQDLADDDLFTILMENFPLVLRTMRQLSKRDQEFLLSYYLLGKTQNVLAIIFHSTQTLCSFHLKMATKCLGSYLLNTTLTQPRMTVILTRHGLEESLPGVPLSVAIDLYSQSSSYAKVAECYSLHRPDIKRAIRRAQIRLEEIDRPEEQALAAYIQRMIEKKSASGKGLTVRQRSKEGHIFKIDSYLLGSFRVDMSHPDFRKQVFVSRANN